MGAVFAFASATADIPARAGSRRRWHAGDVVAHETLIVAATAIAVVSYGRTSGHALTSAGARRG